jgi:acetyltransferase-like isoleucine patch superfamily enzyme
MSYQPQSGAATARGKTARSVSLRLGRRLYDPSVEPVRRKLGRSYLAGRRLWDRARAKSFSVAAGPAFATFGTHSVIQPPIRLTGEAWIAIGTRVFIGPGSWLQVLGRPDVTAIEIGDGTSIVGDCVLSAAQSIRLGERVLLARNVYIADHMHRYDERSRAVLDQGITRVGPVEICDGAWLGQNVVIGPNVRVGIGSVVGANSVVLSDIPDYSVAVGAPARVVRSFGAATE